MNPIKITIFLFSLEFVEMFWLITLSTLYKADKKIWTIPFGIVTLLNSITIGCLSFYIPYSVYWLMKMWRW